MGTFAWGFKNAAPNQGGRHSSRFQRQTDSLLCFRCRICLERAEQETAAVPARRGGQQVQPLYLYGVVRVPCFPHGHFPHTAMFYPFSLFCLLCSCLRDDFTWASWNRKATHALLGAYRAVGASGFGGRLMFRGLAATGATDSVDILCRTIVRASKQPIWCVCTPSSSSVMPPELACVRSGVVCVAAAPSTTKSAC